MRNLGPASARMLAAVGVRTADDLVEIGALDAFRMLWAENGARPTFTMLWALVGAIEDCDWRELPPALRDRLRAAALSAGPLTDD